MLFKNAKFGEKHQNIFYWKVDELTSEQQAPYTINHLDMTVQLNSLHGDWLLLQAPPPIHRTHSAYIVNLAHSTPIPVKTAPSWNTYTIVETNKRQCTIYTGCLHQHSQSDSTLYSWDILRASLIDVRSSSVRGYISLPLRVDKQGERHSRLLTSDIAMVWQAPQKNVKKQTSDAQTWRELCQQRQSSSVFDGNRRNNSVTSVKVENIFFIHNINTSSIYYSGKFIGDTPNVSFCKKQIIILNGSNLKLVNLTSKQTVFETTVANSLIHLGFVLDNYWVAQHPGGGFFTMSMDAQPQIGWIPTDERKGATVVNHAAIVKLSSDGRRLLIWNMHRN
ncbi:hypothetical protein BDF22DRAFT_668181 [Syncephalis plumigaleata]|nr:hypothetical protein BDF22DRAFT_668181 [Syncephalis plumigaleata]